MLNMAEPLEIAQWECPEGFNKSMPLELGVLVINKVIILHTSAPASNPETHLKITDQGEEPDVLIVSEDGLKVAGDPIILKGTSTKESWEHRQGVWPDEIHTGLIIPGERLVFDSRRGPFVPRYWIKGWKLKEKK